VHAVASFSGLSTDGVTLGPSERAARSLPRHLHRHVVAQDYAAYTARDQAVWRHILRQLVHHLADCAHPAYLRGLEATGIGTERIPSLDDMNEKLSRLGWSAIAVRGFIPPAVFTELQALRVLAIAGDIRTHEHIDYTPAPDIVHESAGHAPFLADPAYAAFLQAAGELGLRAIASVEDEEVYESIRALSIAKEDPSTTPRELQAAQERLEQACASRRFVSEATLASRLYWWTAEYGLVGTLEHPKIYGAGLLSSIAESRHCFSDEVERIPLDVRATEVEYDITRMQPQLFVARQLEQLEEVVHDLARTLSFQRGGDHGLRQALAARTVNHVGLDRDLAVTGIVEALHDGATPAGPGLATALATLRGPTMVSRARKALRPREDLPALIAFGEAHLPDEGPFQLDLATHLSLSGRLVDGVACGLRASIGSREVAVPPRARVLASRSVPSVAAGPDDPGAWDEGSRRSLEADEGEARARARKAAALPPQLAALYREVRSMRESGRASRPRLLEIAGEAGHFPDDWLLHLEVDELLAESTPALGPA